MRIRIARHDRKRSAALREHWSPCLNSRRSRLAEGRLSRDCTNAIRTSDDARQRQPAHHEARCLSTRASFCSSSARVPDSLLLPPFSSGCWSSPRSAARLANSAGSAFAASVLLLPSTKAFRSSISWSPLFGTEARRMSSIASIALSILAVSFDRSASLSVAIRDTIAPRGHGGIWGHDLPHAHVEDRKRIPLRETCPL